MLKTNFIKSFLNFRRLKSSISFSNENLFISKSVQEALNSNKPVVALESTIISHGMPYPQNIQCAMEVEECVLKNGAMPATIGIINGKIHIGMEKDDLELLGKLSSDKKVRKCSRRDLPVVISNSESGGTTVAATMYLSSLVGIDVFATGGIGGVHRGAFDEHTLDVSADVIELGRTPVAVISSGIKSILDVGQTLEMLETQGVTVATFRSKCFPTFFTNETSFESPYELQNERQVARLTHNSKKLNLNSGLLIAVPNPEPAEESVIQKAIADALLEARDQGIHGKHVTPFLLKSINEATDGKSLASNIVLIKNNASVAARVAKELKNISHNAKILPAKSSSNIKRNVFVVGGVNQDLTIKPTESVVDGSSIPSSISTNTGGVGLNMCTALARLVHESGYNREFTINLVSAVGSDDAGRTVLDQIERDGIMSLVQVNSNSSTGRYVEQVDSEGEMMRAFNDMKVMDFVSVAQFKDILREGDIILIDASLSEKFYKELSQLEIAKKCTVIFEGTSVYKVEKALLCMDVIDCLTPNVMEFDHLQKQPHFVDNFLVENKSLLIKRGTSPAVYKTSEKTYMSTPPTLLDENELVNTRGCGDTFTAGFVFGKYIKNLSIEQSLELANRCAGKTALTEASVADVFNID